MVKKEASIDSDPEGDEVNNDDEAAYNDDNGASSDSEGKKPAKGKKETKSKDKDKKPNDSKAKSRTEEESKPAPKKRKVSDDEEETPGDNEGSSSTPNLQTNADGERYIELNEYKRVTVRQYNGKTLVDIRDFYKDKKTGEKKPGAKGISLSLELWEALKAAIPAMEEEVKRIESKQ